MLDAFNRADGGLGASWTALYNTLAISSNQVTGPSGNIGVSVFNTTYGADAECYIDIPTIGNTGDELDVGVRHTTQSLATDDGYNATLIIAAGTDTVAISRIDNSAFTQLGATINQNFANGDSLGIEAIGSTIKAYIKTGGTWSDISSGGRSDATYGSAGYSLLAVLNTTYRVDNFSGGTVVAATTYVPRHGFILHQDPGMA